MHDTHLGAVFGRAISPDLHASLRPLVPLRVQVQTEAPLLRNITMTNAIMEMDAEWQIQIYKRSSRPIPQQPDARASHSAVAETNIQRQSAGNNELSNICSIVFMPPCWR